MPKPKTGRKKLPKRVLALPDLEQAKTAVPEHPDVRQRPTHLRPRDSRVRLLVLLGTPPRVQPYGGSSLSDPPRATPIRPCNHQSAAGSCPPYRVQGCRRRSAKPGTRRWHPSRQRGAPSRGQARQLVDARTGPTAAHFGDAVHPAPLARLRDARHAHRLRATARRIARSDARIAAAAREPLSDR